MEIRYDDKRVYRVWYGGKSGMEKEAFFTSKDDAREFSERVKGIMNVWGWAMKIEQ